MGVLTPLTSSFLQGRALISLRPHRALTDVRRPEISLSNRDYLIIRCSTKLPHRAAVPNGQIRSFLVHAQVGGSDQVGGGGAASDQFLKRFTNSLRTLWTFVGPFTTPGTILAATAWAARVYLKHPQGQPYLLLSSFIVKALSALLALLCVQGYVFGINQIYDVEIDKVNKPSRPLPSGDMSVQTAWISVISMVVVGFLILMANKAPPLLFALYSSALLLATAYSVPPFRFKETPLAASLTIGALRAFLNFGTYLALEATLPFPFHWSPPMTFITIFSTVIGFVFGILKDLTDVEGDQMHGIFTLAATLGLRKTTFLGAGIIMLLYIVGVAVLIVMPRYFNGVVMIVTHIILASSLAFRVWLLDRANYGQKECLQFYMFTWGLYYAEQILFPFM